METFLLGIIVALVCMLALERTAPARKRTVRRYRRTARTLTRTMSGQPVRVPNRRTGR